MRRDPGLEAARALAMLGVVLLHAGVAYMTTPIGWAIRDTSTARAADLLVWSGRQFLMPTFFLLSGWMCGRNLARLGAGAVVRQRARRLVLPLLLFLLPMSLAMNALWRWGRALQPRDDVAAPVPALATSELAVTLGHLWYLYYLIALTVLALLAAAAWRHAPARVRHGWTRAVHAVDRRGLTAPLLAVPTAGLLAAGGQLQLDTPLGFALDPLILAYFGAFFAWGWWLGDGTTPPRRARAPLAFLAAAGVIALLVPPLIASVDGARPSGWALYAAALSSWLLVTALVDGCRRWQGPPAALGYLALASFWTYLVHLPLVVLLQLGAARLHAPGPLELVVIVAITLAASLGSFALVRATALGRLVADRTPSATEPGPEPAPGPAAGPTAALRDRSR